MKANLNQTPSGERLHIGIFGKGNAGKSSLLNALTGQDKALVSPYKGTTTDPVYKSMELLPIGPVMFIDTAGIDDESEIGSLRISKTRKVLRKVDLALLVVDAQIGITVQDRDFLSAFQKSGVKHLIVFSKSELVDSRSEEGFYVSAATGENIHGLKEKIAEIGSSMEKSPPLVSDLIEPGDIVALVVPIDKGAPKGRLILPQQQVIRDILDSGATAFITQDTGFKESLAKLNIPPKLVITDSQVFKRVAEDTPEDIPLTSFSILMARYKGVLEAATAGAAALDTIKDGDKILISEACTHHRQCDDIATIKLPKLIAKHTSSSPVYEFSSGGEFPDDLSGFKLIIHCGGCMVNSKEMQYRNQSAADANVPITNFGVAISHMNGILDRCLAVNF